MVRDDIFAMFFMIDNEYGKNKIRLWGETIGEKEKINNEKREKKI